MNLQHDSATIARVSASEPSAESPFASLRVAMIAAGFPSEAAPSSCVFNLRAAKALSRLVKLRVISLRAWKPGRRFTAFSEYEGLPVTTLAVPQVPGTPLLNISLYRWLGWPLVRSLLRDCDLIHSVDAFGAGTVASSWAEWAGLRHVVQVIGTDANAQLPAYHRHSIVAGWEQHVHAVSCNSVDLARVYREVYPSTRNLQIVYRGTNLKVFQPQGPTAGPLSGRSPVRFLFLGGFYPYPAMVHGTNRKGGETLLEAWQSGEDALAAAGASLLFAGDRTDDPRIAAWRAGLKHPERVAVEGVIPPSLIPSYLRSADVVLLPSMEDGLPNVAVEASACGRAVFGSTIGGIPEVVAHGQSGLILPAGDVPAWRDALVAFASREEELRAMGQQARRRMEENFDCDRFAPAMLEVYRAALAGA